MQIHAIARKHAVAQSFVVQDNSRETFAEKAVGPKQVVKFLLRAAVAGTAAETVKIYCKRPESAANPHKCGKQNAVLKKRADQAIA